MDRLKYEIFHRLWVMWHMRLRRLFDPEYKYVLDSRPWYYICCNGDAGGWRTRVCDYLEHSWRGTRYYNRED